MKYSPLALCLALLLTSCAGVRVTHTDVATGGTSPRSIYIKPFDVSQGTFVGHHHSEGELPIRKSLAPAEFTEILKESLEEIAPAMVLKPGDVPKTGWLVEGSIDYVNAGSPLVRAIPLNLWGSGASHIKIHVRVIDLQAHGVADEKDAKEAGTAQTEPQAVGKPGRGAVIYEFDVAGGSHATGKFGSVTAPGLGYAPPIDYRNAAERIYEALIPDGEKFGTRESPGIQ